MNNNQRGGVVAFSIVALVLFLALVGTVFAVKEFGPAMAEETNKVATNTKDKTDEKAKDEAKKSESDVKKSDESKNKPDTDNTDDKAPSNTDDDTAQTDTLPGNDSAAEDIENPEQSTAPDSQTTETDDFDEVVEAPDDATDSTASGRISSTGPSPQQVAATGPTEDFVKLISLSSLTVAGVSFVRSRRAL